MFIDFNQNEVSNNQLKKAAFRLPRKQGFEVIFTREGVVVLVCLALSYCKSIILGAIGKISTFIKILVKPFLLFLIVR